MAMTPEQKNDAYKFFIVAFGAAPGVEYMNQLDDAYGAGMTSKQIVNVYSTKPQFEAKYPKFLTNEQFADRLIENVVGASATDAAKTAAKADVEAALNAGWSRGDVVYQIFQNLSNKADDDAEWGGTAQMLKNKVEVAEYITETLDINTTDLGVLGSLIANVTQDPASVDAAKEAAGGTAGEGYALTSGTDVATSNMFTAGQVYTPGGDDRINSLQNDDVLTGTGINPTLNATLGNPGDNGNAVITPTLRGIETINARYDATGVDMTLDLQDATGVKAVNITRIADGRNATVQNIASAVDHLSIANSNAPTGNVNFTFLSSAVSGTDDSTELKLSNVNVASVRVEERGANPANGFETINLVSTGATNKLGTLTAEDLQTLTVAGDQDLTLGVEGVVTGTQGREAARFGTAFANVAGSLETVDASAFEGDLTIALGAEINAGKDGTSGVPVQFTFKGGKGDDTVVLNSATVGGAANNTDRLDGGEGENTLVVTGTTTIAAAGTAAAPVANVTNFQNLAVLSGHNNGFAGETVNINAAAFDKLENIYIRNEGQTFNNGTSRWESAAETMTVNLTNLTSAQANAITLAHGTTGNSTIANNVINVGLKTATGAADTATVTIVDGVNADPVFNANIGAAGVERVTLVDQDTESNTVHLNQGVYTQAGSSITVTGGAAGQYMNLDSFGGVANAAGGAVGYGYATNGTAGSSTTVAAATAAIPGVPAAVSTSARDNAVSSVLFGTAGTGADGATRHTVENVDASGYAGDFIVRLGETTRADGVSSMNIKSGAGNDTFIFDAIGSTSAGFTSGDTIVAGAGTDTLVLDGNTATIPGTPRINVQTSEWDNLKGIDVLRFGNNAGVANVGNGAAVANAAGAYYVQIDNDFVSQTDAGDRLTIVNNDGRLDANTESDAVVDLRGLSQNKWVTFVGANGVGNAAISSNRIVVDDVSANQNQILDGGDTDVRDLSATGWAGYAAGNNNVYEVRNTANVSLNDLAQTKNFGRIEFTNDQASAQTLTLTLNNAVIENLVDASRTATNAATAEQLVITASDNGGNTSSLNIDARNVTGFHSLNVTGSAGGNDVVTLNANLGGSASTLALGGGNDRVNWTGGSANTVATVNMFTGKHTFQDGGVSTTHDVAAVETVDLTGLQYLNSNVTGSVTADTIIGGAGADVITGGAGADVMTGGNGADVFNYGTLATVSAQTGITLATADTITDFVSGMDTIKTGTAGTALNYLEAVAAVNFVTAQANADAAFDGTVVYYLTSTVADGGLLFVDSDANGTADAVIKLTGITAANFAFTDIVA